MIKKIGCSIIVFMVLGALFFYSNVHLVRADLKLTGLGSSLNFVGNDVDNNGILWAGDKNFTLWKSLDNGTNFQYVYRLPHELPKFPDNPFSGLVWTVFVDSRGYIFTSGGGANNSLYCSTNGGASFTAVLNANDTSNRSFYISMTEDGLGNLYAATYTIGFAQPQLLKSTNGGTSWIKTTNFSILHFHSIKFNPFNGYLYAITGERNGLLSSVNDSEKIFRSKNYGANWTLVVDRNDKLGTVYLPMTFDGNWVYVGQDYPNRICQIHRFYDDGSNGPFVPQVVYTPPNDGYLPFVSGTFFNNTLIFANCAEYQNGTSRIVASADGLNWNVLTSSSVLSTDNRWNFFTAHPRSSIIFGTMKTGYSYQINDVQPIVTPTPTPAPSPTPTPAPSPSPEPTDTPSPMETPTPSASPNPTSAPQPNYVSTSNSPTPTPSPKPKAMPTPKPIQLTPKPTLRPTTPTSTPSQTTSPRTIEPYFQMAIVTAVIIGGSLLSAVLMKRKQERSKG